MFLLITARKIRITNHPANQRDCGIGPPEYLHFHRTYKAQAC